MASTEEQIKQMYGSSLASKKEQLATDYENALSSLDQQKIDNQKVTDANLRRTAVEAQKAKMNNEEYYAASGLSSGARAQARLSQENQLQADMTALRTAQQEADAAIERQRGLLAKEYESAIRQAQAENDLALAQALYEQAEKEDAKLLAKQEAAAGLMAAAGDYSLYGQLYGLTDAQVAKLNGVSTSANSSGGNGGSVSTVDNGGLNREQIRQLQRVLNKQGGYGLDEDGLYGAKSRAAAGGLSAADAYQKYVISGAANADSFIKQNMTLDQAISRGIGVESWKAMINQALNKAILTEEEFDKLEAHYQKQLSDYYNR